VIEVSSTHRSPFGANVPPVGDQPTGERANVVTCPLGVTFFTSLRV